MHTYTCKKCNLIFETRKKGQQFCSRSCSNSFNTTARKIDDISIFENGINAKTAYILGIIISDGCISYDAHSKRYRITISMNDYSIIEFLRNEYSPTKKIYEYKNKISKYITYTFISTNDYDIRFLNSIGINERKSYTVKLPDINEKYYRHLIRGIFDGDGSVYVNTTTTRYNDIVNKYKYINASFTSGSHELLVGINKKLERYEIKSSIVRDSRENTNSWYLKIYSVENIDKLYKYMYSNAKLYLARKKDKFKVMI